MTGYYERRKSRAAIWCLRLAMVAVPYFILTVYLHRSTSIQTVQAFWLLAFGIAMVIGALLLGLRATVDLWEKGYEGGRSTVNGMALSLLLLSPFGYQLFQALDNPQLNDLATDVINPPVYLTGQSSVSNQPNYDQYKSRVIVSSYPQIITRRYNAAPERVLTSVFEILKRWGWTFVAGKNVPEQLQEQLSEESDEAPASEAELGGGLAAPLEENGVLEDIIVQIEAKSFIMKLKSDLVIRLTSDGDSTLVDMRSVSHWGPHDFGSNAANIDDLMNELDFLLAGVAGEN